MKKTLSCVLLFACLATPSCVGPNNAFNGLVSWNARAADSRWVNELIYLGLWIVPVYEVSLALDGLVFNSLEFWGMENPIGKPAEIESQAKR
jgi:hypothetical protein